MRYCPLIMAIVCAIVCAIVGVAGCATTANVPEYVDTGTAATISVADSNWIFARERPDLAVHAQDYVTMTPVQVNRGGKRQVYLYCQLWSTIDRRRDNAIVPPNSELALIADDRRILLPPNSSDIRRLGFSHPPVSSPNSGAEVRVVAIDAGLLRSIANASEVRVALKADGLTEYFLTWRSGQTELLNFLHRVEAGQ